MTIIEELKWRGLLYDQTDGSIDHLSSPRTVYTGFDPTGDSLHVGSLVPLIGLARMQRAGHTPIALAGGATGMVGDPSGKTDERQLISREQVEYNLSCIKEQLAAFLDFTGKNAAAVLNNADWLSPMTLLDFLRDVGKHFTVNYMQNKDSVKSRIDRESTGISFTEFSYMLLQAYDFHHLHQHYQCSVQAGGSDQWGNITAGIELIRRSNGGKGFGLVYPLVTKSDGTKFGKTEQGTVWLDPKKTSPYQFYQFWRRTADQDVIGYLKWLTFLDRKSIAELNDAVLNNPGANEAQQVLASEMTRMVHGETALQMALRASRAVFSKSLEGLNHEDMELIFSDIPHSTLADARLGQGVLLADVAAEDERLTKSKGEATRLMKNGGLTVNYQKITDRDFKLTREHVIDGRYVLLGKGKNYHLLKITDS